jgi:hypothetical protein
MPPTTGVTPEGFLAPTQTEILAQIEADQLSQISGLLDVSSDSAIGQVNRIFSERLAELWELLGVAYNGFDLDAAKANELTSLGKLTGTLRRGASHSIALVDVALTKGTTLEHDTHFAHVTGQPDVRFTPQASFTAPTNGTFRIRFRSEFPGPVAVPAGQLTVIATPVVGWDACTNDEAASGGRPPDDDPTLRRRIEEKITQAGGSTLAAVTADVMLVAGVETAEGFENTQHYVVNGMPPHSFEILVYDGEPNATPNDAIAQAIWDTRPAGIQSAGSQVGTARDLQGVAHEVRFSRVTVTTIWIEMSLVTTTGYPGDDVVKDYVTEQANHRFSKPGDDVLALFVRALPLDIEGVLDVPTFRIGIAPGPLYDLNIDIEDRALPRFDATRILIES